MDSSISKSLDKSEDVNLSTDTFPTHSKTDRETETVSDHIIKQETFVDDSLNIKQETFPNVSMEQDNCVDECFSIKEEIKNEELFDENVISPVGEVGVREEETFSNSLDIKHECGNKINSYESCGSFETDDRNLQCMNSRPLCLKYQDGETVAESSGAGTSSFFGNDIQGNCKKKKYSLTNMFLVLFLLLAILAICVFTIICILEFVFLPIYQQIDRYLRS